MSRVLEGIGLWLIVVVVLGGGIWLFRGGVAALRSGRALEDGPAATALRLSVAVVLIVVAFAIGVGWLIRHL